MVLIYNLSFIIIYDMTVSMIITPTVERSTKPVSLTCVVQNKLPKLITKPNNGPLPNPLPSLPTQKTLRPFTFTFIL